MSSLVLGADASGIRIFLCKGSPPSPERRDDAGDWAEMNE